MKFLFSVPERAKINFVNNFAMMLRSGISINVALDLSAKQSRSGTLTMILNKVNKEIESGLSLTEAFGRIENVFGPIFISMIRAGESSGQLEENLVFVADWMERNADLKRDIRAATLYPKIVLSIAILIGGGLTMFVLPQLITLFEGLRVELPLSTKILMAISVFSQNHWLAMIISMIIISVILLTINRLSFFRRIFQRLYFKIPFIGDMVKDYEIALISQIFSTLLKSGVSINKNLSIIAETTTSILYHESMEQIQKHVVKGTTLSVAMSKYTDLYPENFVNIIAAGEKSGSLEDSFGYLNVFYVKEIKNKTKILPTVLEPILLLFIAFIVGFIAIAIITPIYSITSGLEK